MQVRLFSPSCCSILRRVSSTSSLDKLVGSWRASRTASPCEGKVQVFKQLHTYIEMCAWWCHHHMKILPRYEVQNINMHFFFFWFLCRCTRSFKVSQQPWVCWILDLFKCPRLNWWKHPHSCWPDAGCGQNWQQRDASSQFAAFSLVGSLWL